MVHIGLSLYSIYDYLMVKISMLDRHGFYGISAVFYHLSVNICAGRSSLLGG